MHTYIHVCTHDIHVPCSTLTYMNVYVCMYVCMYVMYVHVCTCIPGVCTPTEFCANTLVSSHAACSRSVLY